VPPASSRRARFDRNIHRPEDEIDFFVVEAVPSGEEH
jgi:hypothetical protein